MSVASIEPPRAPRRVAVWTLQAVVAAAFFAAGAAKLSGMPIMVQLFDQIGLGQWFRVLTAVVEIAGAVLLLSPRLAPLGGLWLAATMFFAVITHLFVLHTSPVPAVVLGLLNALIVYLRRDELASLALAVLRRV
jgi:uncharacterized membrane protein YphA (DoxX/SURF4 family)